MQENPSGYLLCLKIYSYKNEVWVAVSQTRGIETRKQIAGAGVDGGPEWLCLEKKYYMQSASCAVRDLIIFVKKDCHLAGNVSVVSRGTTSC